MNPTKKILLIDDHEVVLAGTRLLLQNSIPSLEIDDASSGEIALQRIKAVKYDMIILDVNMPNFHPFTFISMVKSLQPSLGILVFSMNPEESFGQQFLKIGVNGYLSKESAGTKLAEAVKRILEGKTYFSEELLYSMVVGENNHHHHVRRDLSAREFEVMHQLVKGLGITEIAKLMHLAPSTVATHKANIFQKLGVTNTIQLSQYVNAFNP